MFDKLRLSDDATKTLGLLVPNTACSLSSWSPQVKTTGIDTWIVAPSLYIYTFLSDPWPIPHSLRTCCLQLISGTSYYISQDSATIWETNADCLKQWGECERRGESVCVINWKDPEVAHRIEEWKAGHGIGTGLLHASQQQQELGTFSDDLCQPFIFLCPTILFPKGDDVFGLVWTICLVLERVWIWYQQQNKWVST